MTNEITETNQNAEKQFQRIYNKAFYYQANDQIDQAISHYKQALEYNPTHLATLQVLAYLLHEAGEIKDAKIYYSRALSVHPLSHSLQLAIASCHEKLDELEQAKVHYEKAIDLRQDYAVALNNYGNICRKLGFIDLAEENLLKALRLKISVETLANLGLLMYEKRQYTLAESFYDHALRLEPDNTQVKWNKSLLYLSQKRFSQGWKLYDTGLLAGTRPKQVTPLSLSDKDYCIDYFRNKSVYIHSEQGIGDEVMYASCFQEVIDVAKTCTIECDDRIAPMFQRSFKNINIVAKSDTLFNDISNTKPDADVHVSVASLPRFLRHKIEDFPIQHSYLNAYDRAKQQWKNRYEQLGKGLKVGISWRGGCNEEHRKRSNTLEQWSNIIATPGCHFINLQYGSVEEELKTAAREIHEWDDTDHFHNIEQLAAQIASLDLVITVSNVTAHVAGALGVPVWVMLPYSPNWRWFEGNNPSLWYKCAKLFRQQGHGDWQSVTIAIETELRNVIIKTQNNYQPVDIIY